MLADLWAWLEALPLAEQIGATWWFPLLESFHVLSSTFVVGSILMVDLRLLNLAGTRYPVTRIIREVIPWFKSSFQLRMDDKKATEIPVSRVQTKRLRTLLKL